MPVQTIILCEIVIVDGEGKPFHDIKDFMNTKAALQKILTHSPLYLQPSAQPEA